MNRREFLVAVGAVSVATYFGSLPTLKAETWTLNDWYLRLYPWQQHLWNMLQRGKNVMYVTGTQRAAYDAFNTFRRHERLHCTSIGSAIAGRGADLIIMDDFNDDMNEEWFDACIRTRLYPEGKIEWVYT